MFAWVAWEKSREVGEVKGTQHWGIVIVLPSISSLVILIIRKVILDPGNVGQSPLYLLEGGESLKVTVLFDNVRLFRDPRFGAVRTKDVLPIL